jgi:integrase/recombinase XerD
MMMAPTKISPLRARMIEDMKLAGLAASTQDSYIEAVVKLSTRYGGRRPDGLTEDEVRAHLVGMIDRGAARGTFQTNHYGLQFFYRTTLGRDWSLFKKRFDRRSRSACPSRSVLSRSAACWAASGIRSTEGALR